MRGCVFALVVASVCASVYAFSSVCALVCLKYFRSSLIYENAEI